MMKKRLKITETATLPNIAIARFQILIAQIKDLNKDYDKFNVPISKTGYIYPSLYLRLGLSPPNISPPVKSPRSKT